MTDLEKHLTKVREQLDTADPPSGHQRRFRKKLQSAEKPVRKINVRHALQIAASIAVIAASGIVIVKTGKGGSKMAADPLVNEYQETQHYYAQQVSARYEDIEAITFTAEEEKEVLLEELASMDRHYQILLKELDANPGDPRVINALIRHYQIKLGVMDQIIDQLQQLQTVKTEENEKSNI